MLTISVKNGVLFREIYAMLSDTATKTITITIIAIIQLIEVA